MEEFTERITNTVDTVIEESVEYVLLQYPHPDNGRKNELANGLRQDTRRLFGQIERGLTIEFRAEPNKNAPEDGQKSLQSVATMGRMLVFPQVSKEPLLLDSGQIIEGDLQLVHHSKKTTTTKTSSTSKKETRPPAKPESTGGA